MAFSLLALGLTAHSVAWNPSQEPNMNGDYIYSKTPGAPNDKEFPTNYRDYPGSFVFFLLPCLFF